MPGEVRRISCSDVAAVCSREQRRQAASQIVVPQGPLPPMGGAGGGGKIQMP